ncbi:fasciclin domain-containing protein [Fodinibius sediminis]|uniref:Fasciclin domain-containing protein n=1 Tax=Fodinibius sediminis TaxID=1214077 RepID=A0A521BED4_9BACT|nr:fasciclin domain-containing protein [Fodinibius sediminis]SMO45432.1 Fasciclin domain-containing protein [Fodinibius sediminis]
MKSYIQKLILLSILLAGLGFTACDDDSTSPDSDLTALETIEQEDDLSSYYDYLSEQAWSDSLSKDAVTVFAPTNNALSESGADSLSDQELTRLLQYHVVEKALTHDELKETDSETTLSGESITFTADGDTVAINGDQALIASDGIEASNGMVFIIDTLLAQPQE